jgi:hypothetical protein
VWFPFQYLLTCFSFSFFLKKRIPAGYTFTVGAIEYRGEFQLDPGVSASPGGYYYFQGGLPQVEGRSEFRGPTDRQSYAYRELFGGNYLYSPCGKPAILNINFDLRMNSTGNKAGHGYITSEAIEGSADRFFLLWKTCTV